MATRTPTYYTGTITGAAGTLITLLDTVLVTGEGWTKTYSGTNKAVYTQATGNGFCLRVLDDGSMAAGAKEAIVRGAESATDVDTLVDPFPTVAQVSDATCIWRKSNTADGTTRTYHCVADGNCFHLLIIFDGSTARDMYSFGDTEPHYSGDGYNTFITTRTVGNVNNNATCTTFSTATGLASGTATPIMWFARSADGLIKSDHGFWIINCGSMGYSGTTDPDYPNTATNKLHFGIIDTQSCYSNTTAAIQSGAMLRGAVPHLLEPLLGSGTGVLAEGDTFSDSAYEATSNSLLLLATESGSFSTMRKVIFQVAGTWDPGY
jgi:hypothetical protein